MLQRQAATVILVAVVSGCAPERGVPEGTGASQCMHGFFQALVEKDWPRAYASLDPQSKRLWTERRFAQSASRYLAKLGFQPDTVQIRYCAEDGDEARGRVVLTGPQKHHYKDAVTLRRGDHGWAVVLPPSW